MSKVNINGVWKDLDKVFVNIGGVWKEAEKMFCNIGGVWKEVEGLGLQGLYAIMSRVLNDNVIYERLKLNPTTLATLETVRINDVLYNLDYGAMPNRLLGLQYNGYIHEMNPDNFAIITSTKIYDSMTGSITYQHNQIGGTSNYVYTTHFVTYYGDGKDYDTQMYKRNPISFASIYQKNESAHSYGEGQIRGIDGIGSRLYRYYYSSGYERIQEVNPDNFTMIRQRGHDFDTFAGGLGGGSDGSLIGGLNLGYENANVFSYNIDTLVTINSRRFMGTAIVITSIINLK